MPIRWVMWSRDRSMENREYAGWMRGGLDSVLELLSHVCLVFGEFVWGVVGWSSVE